MKANFVQNFHLNRSEKNLQKFFYQIYSIKYMKNYQEFKNKIKNDLINLKYKSIIKKKLIIFMCIKLTIFIKKIIEISYYVKIIYFLINMIFLI